MKSIKWSFLVTFLALAFVSSGCWGNSNKTQNKEVAMEELEEEEEEKDKNWEEEEEEEDWGEDIDTLNWEESVIETDTTETGF